MKRCVLMVVALMLVLSYSFAQSKNVLVGVAMPTQSLQRWNQDGANLKAKLEAKGYKVVLQYANNDVNTQLQQLENMVTQGAKVLVIASIDGSVLSDVLKRGEKHGGQRHRVRPAHHEHAERRLLCDLRQF